jgi:hypothetical protein
MPDTRFSEGGREWPRSYRSSEIHLIAGSLGLANICPITLEKLQEAAQGYQWASLEEEEIFPEATNKGRREQLNQIGRLCAEGAPADAIEAALYELDAPTSQCLGAVSPLNRKHLARSIRRVLGEIKKRGPDAKRARRQFIYDLADIYEFATGQPPGRRVHDEEYGPFHDFVIAALEPFKAAPGCDIKAVLQQRNTRSRKRKSAAGSKP